MRYKISWNTKELKENGHTVHDLRDYLENYGCHLDPEIYGGSITFSTNKSKEGLFQEVRRVFNVEIKITEQ